METINEIEVKNEVMEEVTEEVTTTGSGTALKVVAGIGLALLVGGIIYKCVAKYKAAKAEAEEQQMIEADYEDHSESDVEGDVE